MRGKAKRYVSTITVEDGEGAAIDVDGVGDRWDGRVAIGI